MEPPMAETAAVQEMEIQMPEIPHQEPAVKAQQVLQMMIIQEAVSLQIHPEQEILQELPDSPQEIPLQVPDNLQETHPEITASQLEQLFLEPTSPQELLLAVQTDRFRLQQQ